VVEGRRIVPKSLTVAKLLSANIKREMKFTRIRKTLHKAPFHEIVRVVLNDATTVNLTPHSLQLIEKLNASLFIQVDKQEISCKGLIDKLNTSMAAFQFFQTETGNAFGKINTTFSKQMEAMDKLNTTIKAFKEETNNSMSTIRATFTERLEKNHIPAGTIIMWTNTSIPPGWLLCDGSSLARTDYEELFDSIGTMFGSNDTNTFNLPNLYNRFPIGAGDVHPLGNIGGEKDHLLSLSEMPQHIHPIRKPDPTGKNCFKTLGLYYKNQCMSLNSNEYFTNYAPKTATRAHNNMPPYIGIFFIIKF